MALPKDQTLPPDLTRSFTAVRGQAYADSQEDDPDDDALLDNGMILNGSRAITGPAAFSPLRADSPMHRKELEKQQQEQSDKKRRDAAEREQIRELENLAEWNARLTVIDGVSMTNEDAQKARKHIIDHEDEYAQRAVAEGRIKPGDEEAYKAANRKIYEIKDKIGRGTASADEKHTCAQLENSSIGHAPDHDVAAIVEADKGIRVTAASNARSSLQNSPMSTSGDDMFQSAPPVRAHFTASVTNTGVTPTSLPTADPAPTRQTQATGFNP